MTFSGEQLVMSGRNCHVLEGQASFSEMRRTPLKSKMQRVQVPRLPDERRVREDRGTRAEASERRKRHNNDQMKKVF